MTSEEKLRLARGAAEFQLECAKDTREDLDDPEFTDDDRKVLTQTADEMEADGNAIMWCANLAERYVAMMQASYKNDRDGRLGLTVAMSPLPGHPLTDEYKHWLKEQEKGENGNT